MDKFKPIVRLTHDRKLLKLGLHRPRFLKTDKIIHNLFSYNVLCREKFVFTLGL